MTAFPLIETTDGDISSYIPTNLISITDGQIYLDSGRFERNQRPAIDIGRSVSRIGSVAQSPRMRKAAKNLRISISRFESLESLTRVGLEMDVGMQEMIRRGKMLRELLRQRPLARRDLFEQSVALTAVSEDWLAGLETKRIRPFVEELSSTARRELKELVEQLVTGELLGDNWQTPLAELANQVRPRFLEKKNL